MFHSTTTCFLYGKHLAVAQRMIDFDYLCGKSTPSLVGIVSQGQHGQVKLFWGGEEKLFPLLPSLTSTEKTGASVMVNFSSFRSAAATTREAMQCPWISTIALVAEGIPERDTRMLAAFQKEIQESEQRTISLIGPATVGGIAAGILRIGHSGGSLENMIQSKLYRPGSVGLLSKSGGMMNELCRVIANNTDGVHTGISFGGDRYPLLDIKQWLLDFENDKGISMIVMLDEVGNNDALIVLDLLKTKQITKPVVMRVSGSFAEHTSQEVQFGHAGAKASSEKETTSKKLAALRLGGVHVPDSYDDLGQLIGKVRQSTSAKKLQDHVIPDDVQHRLHTIQHRRPTRFSSSISDERGDELTYNGQEITGLVQSGSLGKVIGHLWLKQELPAYACQFLEIALILLADHGPAVSGATNTIVSARAGKDMLTSLISGLATIGPRFGGAIDGAAQWLFDAQQHNKNPETILREHKQKGQPIQGIGHKVKSRYNPDKRCELLLQCASGELTGTAFPSTTYLTLAQSVEALTLEKKANLILNVDGHVAAMLLDIMESCTISDSEIQSFLDAGLFNGIFILARSIGFIGHYLDQKRLGEGLHRTPWEDILYL